MVSGECWPASHGSPQWAMLGHQGLLENLRRSRWNYLLLSQEGGVTVASRASEAGWQSALGSTLSSFVLLTTPACRWELSRWRRRRQRRRPRLPRPEPPSDSAPGAANSSAPHSADPASSALPCPMATRGPPRRPPIGGVPSPHPSSPARGFLGLSVKTISPRDRRR